MSCRCHETGAYGLPTGAGLPGIVIDEVFNAYQTAKGTSSAPSSALTFWQADAYLDRLERVQDEADRMRAQDAFRGAGLRRAADAAHTAISDGVGVMPVLRADELTIAVEALHLRYLAELAQETRPGGKPSGTKGQTPPAVTGTGGTGADRPSGAGSSARSPSQAGVTLGVVALAALAYWVTR